MSEQICGVDFRCHSFIAFLILPSAPGRQKSTIIVVPPHAAAHVPVSNVSAAVVPIKGISKWV